MSEEGYTLAEMLAALVILGLGAAGAAEGIHAVVTSERAASNALAEDNALASAAQGVERLFKSAGPFISDDPMGLHGGPTALAFACEEGICSARLAPRPRGAVLSLARGAWRSTVVLPRVTRAHFIYADAFGESPTWPPVGKPRALVSVALAARRGTGIPTTVAMSRVWTQERPGCAFDAILQDCRRSGG